MKIIKNLRTAFVTTTMLFGLANAAHATVPIFETTGSGIHHVMYSNNAYGFSVSRPGIYQATLTGNQPFSLSILPGFNTTGTILGRTIFGLDIPTFGDGSFVADTAGVYTALLFSPGFNPAGNAYNISVVEVVPEVETWVMVLVGLGLLTYQLRRKNKVQRPSSMDFA